MPTASLWDWRQWSSSGKSEARGGVLGSRNYQAEEGCKLVNSCNRHKVSFPPGDLNWQVGYNALELGEEQQDPLGKAPESCLALTH